MTSAHFDFSTRRVAEPNKSHLKLSPSLYSSLSVSSSNKVPSTMHTKTKYQVVTRLQELRVTVSILYNVFLSFSFSVHRELNSTCGEGIHRPRMCKTQTSAATLGPDSLHFPNMEGPARHSDQLLLPVTIATYLEWRGTERRRVSREAEVSQAGLKNHSFKERGVGGRAGEGAAVPMRQQKQFRYSTVHGRNRSTRSRKYRQVR